MLHLEKPILTDVHMEPIRGIQTAPQPGVRIGVPRTRTIVPIVTQPRQFEYHYTQPLMAIGTINGEVMLANWKTNQTIGRTTLPGSTEPNREPASVLALSWLRQTPDRLVAGCSTGHAAMYKIETNNISMEEEEGEDLTAAAQPDGLVLHHAYERPLCDQMTSLHCNSNDTLLSASGYTHHVNVLDLETGQMLRRLKNIHTSHINIARWANGLPYLLLTCSFDKRLHMFDTRSNARVQSVGEDSNDPESYNNISSTPVPIYTCESRTGVVMVCWSPNDLYFLSSAVDNEVKQFHVVDGKLDLNYAIPPQRLATNYTRSYYMNEGEAVISGSSASDLLYVCSSVDGAVLDTVNMTEARRDDGIYIQSLRGCPLPEHHNRAAVLVCYKKAPITHSYELVDVNMCMDPNGEERDHPLSLSSIIHMADDYRHFLNHSYAADVVISCEGATGDELIYAHQAILHSRWPWFAKHAVWSEGQPVLSAAAALPTSLTIPTSLQQRESGSLDDDDPPDTTMVDVDETATGGLTANQSTEDQPLVFCRVQIAHPSGMSADTHGSSWSSSPVSFDTLTLSSTGMISLELPRVPRLRMLYLLEYLYTGAIPVQSDEDARRQSKAAEKDSIHKKQAQEAKERMEKDFEYLSHARQMESHPSLSKANSTAATASSSSSVTGPDSLRGLDDDDADLQLALLASMGPVSRTTSAVQLGGTPSVTQSTATPAMSGAIDVNQALMNLSLHATPATCSTVLGPTAQPIPPLSARFEAKLALYELANKHWYDLSRLANILERSMRKQLILGWSDIDGEPQDDSSVASIHSVAAVSALAHSTTTTRRSSSIITFSRRVEACVHLGAEGLVSVAQDLIERSFDWLHAVHRWFVEEDLPRLFPPSTSSFLTDLHSRRGRCLTDESVSVQTMQASYPTFMSTQQDGLVLWTGGSSQKTTPPFGPLRMLHTGSLMLSETQCALPPKGLFDESLTSFAACLIHAPSPFNALEGTNSESSLTSSIPPIPTHMMIFGGQTGHLVMSDRLHILDLQTLVWTTKQFHLDQNLSGRKKHTFTNVPTYKRAYIFAGRSAHNCFSDISYIDYSDPSQPWQLVKVQELHASKGRTNVLNPPVRYSHTCTYSPAAGCLIAFGGNGVSGCRNDVWCLDPETNLWECKLPNDTSMLQTTVDAYAAHILNHSEVKPLPRFGHSACILKLGPYDDEYLAIYGGITSFQVGQIAQSDLWLLNTSTWQWQKVQPADPRADPPMNLEEDNLDATVVAQREEVIVPTRRWEHAMFVQYGGTTGTKTMNSGAMSSSSVAFHSPSPSSSPAPNPTVSRPSPCIAIMGGTTIRQAVPWIDVYDFGTRKWSREHAHPASVQPQPTINIEDNGCLWTDMQDRFRNTQPEAFSQPIVEGFASDPSVGSSASSEPFPHSGVQTASIDAAIEFNMSYERALYAHPTPLPACSFVHFLVEGRLLTVPKIVLVSRCPTFLSMLTSSIRDAEMVSKNLIVVEGVRYIIFRCILYFMWCGDEEFVVEIRNHVARQMTNGHSNGSAANKHQLRPSTSSAASSPASSVASTSRGTKRAGEDLSDSDELGSLSLGGLAMGELERSVSAGTKKPKNGHTPCERVASAAPILASLDDSLEALPMMSLPGASSHHFSESSSMSAIAVSTVCVDPLEILVSSDRFNLTSLCNVLEIGLSRQIDVANVSKFLYFAEIYHLSMLSSRCIIYIIQHYETITTEYAEEYGKLNLPTRERIAAILHSLAGSHRGPSSRGESNPLLPLSASSQAVVDDEEDVDDLMDAAMQQMIGEYDGGEDDEDEEDPEGYESEEY